MDLQTTVNLMERVETFLVSKEFDNLDGPLRDELDELTYTVTCWLDDAVIANRSLILLKPETRRILEPTV